MLPISAINIQTGLQCPFSAPLLLPSARQDGSSGVGGKERRISETATSVPISRGYSLTLRAGLKHPWKIWSDYFSVCTTFHLFEAISSSVFIFIDWRFGVAWCWLFCSHTFIFRSDQSNSRTRQTMQLQGKERQTMRQTYINVLTFQLTSTSTIQLSRTERFFSNKIFWCDLVVFRHLLILVHFMIYDAIPCYEMMCPSETILARHIGGLHWWCVWSLFPMFLISVSVCK